MKKLYSPFFLRTAFAVLLMLTFVRGWGQTTILDPSGAGGFELGTTFSSNGWTAANTGGNKLWQIGTGILGYSGARAAFIGDDATSTGSTTTARPAVHLYRSLVIPSSASSIVLKFKYKQTTVDNTFDLLRVYLNGNTPVYGTLQNTGLLTTVDPSTTTSFSNFTEVSVNIPNSFAGTTNNLIFTFTADGVSPHAYGGIDDVSITYTSTTSCSGTPTAGTLSVNPTSGIPGSTYGITATGYTTGSGLTYQWQYSDTGGASWTDQGTATSSYAALTGMVAPAFGVVRTWKLVVTCTASAKSANSTTGTFTSTYCTPTSTYTSDYISNFSTTLGVTNISNLASGLSGTGYGDFYATKSASQYAGSSLNFSETYVGGTSGFKIWVDWNKNGDFTDAGEEVFAATSYSATNSSSFLIPGTTTAGNYRMRIRADYNTLNVSSCGLISFGEAEDYKLTILALTPCSGTPNAGTGLVNGVASGTGNVSSSITLSATGLSTGSGFTFQWYSSPDGTTWNPIAGATTATYVTTAAATAMTTYYQLITTCTNSGLTSKSSNASFVTTVNYCTPRTSTNEANTYINKVQFVGTLNDPLPNTSTYSTVTPGYENFTGLPGKAVQAQGEGINVYVEGNKISQIKAWVDWNKDGDFDDLGEQVFNTNDVLAFSTTFGFEIPASVPLGDYRIRLRNYTSNYAGINFNSCQEFKNTSGNKDFGEAEDYLFTVIESCSSKIATLADGERCGTGSVTLGATATAGVTEFRWYDAQTGGSLVGTSAVTGVSTTWNSPSITLTTRYYVTAYNGSCESLVRRRVVAKVKQTPNVSFTPSTPIICGNETVVELAATAASEEVYLINEDFEGGGLGVFTNSPIEDNGETINGKTAWQNKPSTFIPSEKVWYPAISSGFSGNKFVIATSDIGPYTTENELVSTVLNSTDFTNLTLKFKMYYSDYYPSATTDYVTVEISTNGGANWTVLEKFNGDVGIGTKFENIVYTLANTYLNQTNLKIKIKYHAYWADGVAVDDIELYGNRPMVGSTYSFSSSAPINIYADAGTSVFYTGTSVDKVYIKPDATQLQNTSSWNITATATLTNGCSAVGTKTISNNSKVRNNASTDWSDTNWLPDNAVPTADKCVIIKTPVILGAPTNGLAKNITVQSGGSLTVAGNLTVTDFVKNEGTAGNLTIQSDGNLLQINPSKVINSGNITAERKVTALRNNPGTAVDYVYWSSPVTGQLLKGATGFSPGTPNNRFFYYAEYNDRFYETGDTNFQPGRGYAIRSEDGLGTSYGKTYQFKGTPNNGDFSWPIIRSADNPVGVVHGYNLVGNPYPSNISFDELYFGNSTEIWKTAWFWTNASYTAQQMGSGYTGNNYSVYNATGGNSASYSGPMGPSYATGIVKVGQGFLVQKKAVGSGSLSFKNSYSAGHDLRVTTFGTFFQKGATAKNRFWITLISPDNVGNTQLIGYIPGATNGYEQDYDAEILGMSSDVFYSKVADKKLLIQGKADFINTDKVILGANFFTNGTYTIALDQMEGIFDGSQIIYLKDKETGIVTNLSQGNYIFQATKGISDGRFEIIYQPEIVLSTGANTKENLIIYRDANDFVVKADSKKITDLEVYDSSGRMIYKMQPNNTKAVINADRLNNGVYVLKVNQSGEITTKKVIK